MYHAYIVKIRHGADYEWSLKLLREFKVMFPHIPTKSGLMVGLGETNEEILTVMQDLRNNGVTMLTLGQYLQPSRHHLPVSRTCSPEEFDQFLNKKLNKWDLNMLPVDRLFALLIMLIYKLVAD